MDAGLSNKQGMDKCSTSTQEMAGVVNIFVINGRWKEMKYGDGYSFSWLLIHRSGKTTGNLVSKGKGSSLWQWNTRELLCIGGLVKVTIVSITYKEHCE